MSIEKKTQCIVLNTHYSLLKTISRWKKYSSAPDLQHWDFPEIFLLNTRTIFDRTEHIFSFCDPCLRPDYGDFPEHQAASEIHIAAL